MFFAIKFIRQRRENLYSVRKLLKKKITKIRPGECLDCAFYFRYRNYLRICLKIVLATVCQCNHLNSEPLFAF